MIRILIIILTLVSLASINTLAQEIASVRYAFLVSISNGDTRNQVRQLATDIGTKIAGRDLAVANDATSFQRFILLGTLPEVPVLVVVGVASDVTAPVRSELTNLPPVGVQMFWYSQPLTREQLDAKLLNEARINIAVDHYWPLHPGDSLGGFLPANFLPVQ
jgi:hypothetical protein